MFILYKMIQFFRDSLANRTSQIKEGLNRLSCLVPYNIITFEVSDPIIVHMASDNQITTILSAH